MLRSPGRAQGLHSLALAQTRSEYRFAPRTLAGGSAVHSFSKQSHMALAGHPRRMKSGARRAMLRVDDRDVKVELRLVPRARQAV